MKKQLPLYEPISYINATEEEKKAVCNGCGAKNGKKVFESFFGLDIKEGCQIHDWSFYIGQTLGDFFFSNLMFMWNLFVLVYNGSNWFTLSFRLPLVFAYFLGVMTRKGRDAFWVDKPSKNNSKRITIRGEFR